MTKSVGNAYVMCSLPIGRRVGMKVSTKRWHIRLSQRNPNYLLERVKRNAVDRIKEDDLMDKFSSDDSS